MNAYELLEQLRSNLDESIDATATRWTDKELLVKLSFAYRMAYRLESQTMGDRFVSSEALTPAAGIITLPSDFSKFIYMKETSSGQAIPLLNTIRESSLALSYASSLYDGQLSCYFVGSELHVTQADYATQVTLYYEPSFKHLTCGTGASGSAVNSLILESANGPSVIDDYYNNETVEIVSGTGISLSSTISDYDGGTYTATIVGTVDETSVYGTVPRTSPEAEELIVLEATVAAMAKPGAALDPKYFEYYLSRARDAKKEFKTWISTRHKGSNYVRRTEVE